MSCDQIKLENLIVPATRRSRHWASAPSPSLDYTGRERSPRRHPLFSIALLKIPTESDYPQKGHS